MAEERKGESRSRDGTRFVLPFSSFPSWLAGGGARGEVYAPSLEVPQPRPRGGPEETPHSQIKVPVDRDFSWSA